jgi:hypothetical protein
MKYSLALWKAVKHIAVCTTVIVGGFFAIGFVLSRFIKDDTTSIFISFLIVCGILYVLGVAKVIQESESQ